MARNWKGIVSEVLHLGFEKTKSYIKNKESFQEAANWGQLFLCGGYFPIEEQLIVAHAGGYARYDLTQLTLIGGRECFLGLSYPAPSWVLQNGRTFPAQYRLLGDRLLEVNGVAGSLELWYRRSPKLVSADTAEEEQLELSEQAANILPYLMAYRLWLDDDAEKATTYYNAADDMIKEALATRSSVRGPVAVVREDYYG